LSYGIILLYWRKTFLGVRMPLTDRKPQGVLRLGLRFPIWLYDMGLGGIFGKRFLLLHHLGRKSGKEHKTIIEIIRYDGPTGNYYVASGWGTQADWYLNLRDHPQVNIMVGRRSILVRAVFLDEEEAVQEFLSYAQRHPFAFKELIHLMTGEHFHGTEETCHQLARSIPVVRFQPTL
jgi:deazaflavin-dependent oxidoreductase (nitroreductase family)